MKNALTIDLEDWYHTMDFNFPVDKWDSFEDRVENSVRIILDTLDEHKTKATFFVLGYVARKHPELIKEISNKGHEIGSHGSFHRLVYTQNENEFRQDVRASKELLEGITGKEIKLFRASSWSISTKTLWALRVLQEEGFICDSSVQPFKTPLSGINGAPKEPFYPVIEGRKLDLLEFPPTVLPVGNLGVPFSGGLYLRTMPLKFIKYALKKINATRPGMIYIHPWELDVSQPRLKVPPHIKFTHYYNLNKTLQKVEDLLKNFEFVPLGEIIRDGIYPSASVN